MDTNTKKQIEGLRRKQDALGHHVAELQRKSQGNSLANRRAAQCERRLDEHAEAIERVNTRLEALGDSAGPVQTQAIMAEVTRIESKLDGLWADLNTEIEKLREQVDGHESRLDGHDELFEKLAADNKEVAGRTVVIGESVARAHARIDVLQRARQQTSQVHPLAWVLGIIAGIIAGWAWAVHDWTEQVQVGETVTTVTNTAADAWWAAALVGLGVGLFVLFIASLFIREEHDEPDTVTSAEADAEAGSTIVVDRDARTRAIPVIRDAPAPAADRNAGVEA